jgi:16S rRNA (adenine1518-N6/adenine1519-N6)-dimethyltransferase
MSRSLAAETRGLINRFGLRAKKSLGQHFLIDRRVLYRIVSAAEVTAEDTVVEVGPGLGILTRELAKRARKVIAVVADRGMASAVREMLSGMANVSIIESDILQTDPASLLATAGAEGTSPGYKVVANIPYYITSPILRHFLEASLKPSIMVIMLQKEVGEAIAAQPGKMSILAVSVQFYGKPAIVGRVPSRSFYPPPKVDSVILRIRLYEQPPIKVSQTSKFFAVVRAGFSAPRKQLRNSLAQGLGVSPQEAAVMLVRAMIDSRRRAETLGLDEWARLSEEVNDKDAQTQG